MPAELQYQSEGQFIQCASRYYNVQLSEPGTFAQATQNTDSVITDRRKKIRLPFKEYTGMWPHVAW
jgi:hypothetical protein